MNGWVKHFVDGTTIQGDDNDSQASWSKTRLHGLSAVSIHHNGTHLCISGQGEYWQSDDFESIVYQNGPGEIVARRICFRLRGKDRWIRPLQTEHSTMLKVIDDTTISELMIADKIEAVPTERAGFWLVLEYDIKSGNVHWYYSGARI